MSMPLDKDFETDLRALARLMLEEGPKKIEPTSRRVRVIHQGTTLVDTTKALHVWEHSNFPYYYIPLSGLVNCHWVDTGEVMSTSESGYTKGLRASLVTIKLPSHSGLMEGSTDRAMRFYRGKDGHVPETPSVVSSLAGHMRIEFGSMDHWLEEDTPIYVHPKDPYKRVDILPSSRPIEIRVGDETVARTNYAVHVYETGLPPRYYLPLSAVDHAVLRRSSLKTKCPYKGEAEYFDVVVNGHAKEDLVWYYRYPLQECGAITGMVCFDNDRVDTILDGELMEQPKVVYG
ncbi:DUF427-domain-containing protein [Sodiomyces alkalinus F11]|uniref:DUF427-domain-containing protein n=1 Tax=Sodiomyces alkalinus (strain CBS 110278 / VKM F-3762 / F11) TaxID=1314773 RepID=A0A3N2Q342_SODAK|nr:DUF427-domain-containing protein [Sodiomyces alkalinus F11]ROT41162.1 DUF427-domain-containing protein [Sodiomyces alkalinus F11]